MYCEVEINVFKNKEKSTFNQVFHCSRPASISTTILCILPISEVLGEWAIIGVFNYISLTTNCLLKFNLQRICKFIIKIG